MAGQNNDIIKMFDLVRWDGVKSKLPSHNLDLALLFFLLHIA